MFYGWGAQSLRSGRTSLLDATNLSNRLGHAGRVKLIPGLPDAGLLLDHQGEAGVDAILQQHALGGVVLCVGGDVRAVDRVDDSDADRVGENPRNGDLAPPIPTPNSGGGK